MGFKENKKDAEAYANDLLEGIFTRVLGDKYKEESSLWNEEVPTEASEPEEVNIDLSTTTLVEKVGMVCHQIFDQVLTGELVITTGEELLAITQAASLREQLRDYVK